MENAVSTESTARQRYSLAFVLLLLGSFLFIMVSSSLAGISNFENNLIMKNLLIEKTNWLHLKIGDRVFPEVVIGKGGWMEYSGDGNLDDFQIVQPLWNKHSLAKRLAAFEKYLNEQGITLLIVVAPNKASIYPERLPEEIQPLSTQTRLDYLISALKERNLPPVLDLRPALQQAKLEQEVYYVSNTHWNGYGAFVAYTAILNELSKTHPELQPYKPEELHLGTKRATVQDIAKLLQANFIKEPHFFYVPKDHPVQSLTLKDYYGFNHITSVDDENLPTLLMIHDSFGYRFLNEYMSMNFKKAYFIHSGEDTPLYLNRAAIEQFNPDIIVIEIVERSLNNLNNYLSQFDSPIKSYKEPKK